MARESQEIKKKCPGRALFVQAVRSPITSPESQLTTTAPPPPRHYPVTKPQLPYLCSHPRAPATTILQIFKSKLELQQENCCSREIKNNEKKNWRRREELIPVPSPQTQPSSIPDRSH
ncbi:hypothetical protein M0R45_000034 [Rubus argutus]|uniref:Uncharacterized protein n=1 Tax=Rubus argutus TaxID=59490 RepID=A0AAW1VNH0_RUBAR